MMMTSPGWSLTFAEVLPFFSRLSSLTAIFALVAALLVEADQLGAVAGGEFGQAADRDHGVKQRHVRAVRERRRLLGLADDADLLREAVRRNC